MKAIKWSITAALAVSMLGPIHTVKAADSRNVDYDQGSILRSASSVSSSYNEGNQQVEDLIFQMDATEITVGDNVPVQIYAKDADGISERVPLAQANVVIEKPYLLQKQADGTMKALAVGETNVTVISGSDTKTIKVSISADHDIDQGAFVNGTMYLPVQSVFQTLGATVQVNTATKTFSIRLGDLPIQLQLGSDIAMVNGAKVKMSGKVQKIDGSTVFPATLLKTALSAELIWDGNYQTMEIYFGKAELFAYTKQTAQIFKKEEQGNLVKFIGKTYWLNQFDSDYKFQKVTIVDILPDYEGEFAISFKILSTGQILNSYKMSGDELIRTLGNKEYFLTTDPFKTYKWSDAIWTKIKKSIVATGMTKQQVEFSWGKPISKSTLSGSGIQVETWQYGNYNYVTFTNGVVSMIYTN